MATAQEIQTLRYELADTDTTLPILSDAEYAYFIDKNAGSIRRAMLDAARTILFKLSINSTDSTVDIFSIKGSKAAQQYIEALKLFLRDPNLNPALTLGGGYAGGISKQDMQNNVDNTDNNAVIVPSSSNTSFNFINDNFVR
jgi:hypothetical protein